MGTATETEPLDALIRSGARRLTGFRRRAFIAEVARELCDGNPRQAERRFGWGRDTVAKGLHETRQGMRCVDNFAARGRRRSEDKDPQLAADIRAIVEPHTYADPELKSARRYTNLSAARGSPGAESPEKVWRQPPLPSERCMRDILNRLGYRLRHMQKAKPLKKNAGTDAVFANVPAGPSPDVTRTTRKRLGVAPGTPRPRSTRVNTSRGEEKCRSNYAGTKTPGWDHDPPPKRKWTPLGILTVARWAFQRLSSASGRRATVGWTDCCCGGKKASRHRHGAHQAAGDLLGQRSEERGEADAVAEADDRVSRPTGVRDTSGLLSGVSQQVQSDRALFGGLLEKKWGGTLLVSLKVMLREALRMIWRGRYRRR